MSGDMLYESSTYHTIFSPDEHEDACRGQWESAHRLFLQMQEDNIDYDVVTYNSLLSAYMAGEQADMVRNYVGICAQSSPDAIVTTYIFAILTGIQCLEAHDECKE
jgi:hypothetical protein